jgi:hypothetical protein
LSAWATRLAHAACLLALAVLLALGVAAPARAQSIESVLRPGELVQGHAKVEEECAKCHVRFDRAAQDRLCIDCHKEVGQDMRERTGYHGRQKPAMCRTCHTDHKGRNARIVEFDKNKFDHAQSDYLLRGKHTKVECEKCHEPKKPYWKAPQECNACHKKDDVHKGSLGTKCFDCHTESSWKDAKFDHDKTKFPLTGKHVDTKCLDCHKKGTEYKDAPETCIGCHKKDDDSAKGHKGQYGDKCDTCHGTKAWKPSTFNHDADTKFSLRGKHRTTKCNDCHTGNLYKEKLASTCISCHKKDDTHKGSLGKECASCHTERDWKEAVKFDHDKTQFPLVDKHRDVKCADCHTTKDYKDAPKECIGCHKKDDKHEATLGTLCKDCHNERVWTDVRRFDHDKTKFKLRDAHAASKVKCKDCHSDLKHYRDTPLECYACHKKDDKHEATLGKACADCHNERVWTDVKRFDHDKTKFKLRDAHAASKVKCKDCHSDLKHYRDTPLECYACHKKDDKHEATLGKACADCHNERVWTDVKRFDHDKTKFKLRNAHAALKVKCNDCHSDLKHYRNTPLDCYSCHKKDDKHEGQLGPKCESCHGDVDWKTVTTFDHNRSRFPLLGKHAGVKCKDCHTTARFKDAPRDCYSCHKKDDTHKLKFGTGCELCHNARNWKIWDYDHARLAKYVLDGAHAKVACEKCHTQPAPKGRNAAETGNICISCHRREDVHDGAFGPICEQCHYTDRWKRIRSRLGSDAGPWTGDLHMAVLGRASRFARGLQTGSTP